MQTHEKFYLILFKVLLVNYGRKRASLNRFLQVEVADPALHDAVAGRLVPVRVPRADPLRRVLVEVCNTFQER
jgi:hypothetical protein